MESHGILVKGACAHRPGGGMALTRTLNGEALMSIRAYGTRAKGRRRSAGC